MSTATPNTQYTIAADAALNEIIAQFPQTLPVLQRFGLDTCCGGALSLQVAAQHHGLELAELLAALNAEIGRSAQ